MNRSPHTHPLPYRRGIICHYHIQKWFPLQWFRNPAPCFQSCAKPFPSLLKISLLPYYYNNYNNSNITQPANPVINTKIPTGQTQDNTKPPNRQPMKNTFNLRITTQYAPLTTQHRKPPTRATGVNTY